MATVNFSVPNDVKERFNKTFAGQNKSQIIAELMERAVREQALKKRRAKAIEGLISRRTQRPSASVPTPHLVVHKASYCIGNVFRRGLNSV